LKVVHPAPIFYQLDGKRRLGTLVPGHDAEIIAISERAYKVRAKAEHADVSGWATPKAFESHNEVEFRKILQQLYERQQLVNQLIEKEKIALGMTAREVRTSLGEPDRIRSTLEQGGRSETYEYICYDRVPQYITSRDSLGRLVRTLTWVKVEVGKTVVDLENDSVVKIENTQGAPDLSAPVTIAPPPILVF